MSQNQTPRNPAREKEKIVPHTHQVVIVNMPAVRNYSTGGGHK